MPVALVVFVASVQFLGLAGLGWARMSEGSASQLTAQLSFFLMLVVVAATAAVSVASGSALWPVCAVTFGVMIVGATLSSHRELDPIH